jgi:5-enolpyruvylshikimate-3-phosphate synthase
MFNTEFLDIPPLRHASGTVVLPGSKSISNRVLLLAALSQRNIAPILRIAMQGYLLCKTT